MKRYWIIVGILVVSIAAVSVHNLMLYYQIQELDSYLEEIQEKLDVYNFDYPA